MEYVYVYVYVIPRYLDIIHIHTYMSFGVNVSPNTTLNTKIVKGPYLSKTAARNSKADLSARTNINYS